VVAASIFVTAIMAMAIIAGFEALSLKPIGAVLGATMYVVMFVACIWASYALSIKRLHDQDMSGWWLLLQFVPYLGPFALLIILGFLPGSAGSNQFGSNPNGSVTMNDGWKAYPNH
jgi:uncharacterized membrane protein YhaH (DUF805 family)